MPPAQKLRLQVTEPLPSALIEGAGSGFVVFTDSDNCANVDFATLLISACSNLDVEIGDRLWFDKNGNGLQEIGEPGISGVTVNLYRDDQLVATTVTDNVGRWSVTSADGQWEFGVNLALCTSSVQFVPGGGTPVDFAITQTVGTEPWYRGGTYPYTIEITELGRAGHASDKPIVEAIMQPGQTFAGIRSSAGVMLVDANGNDVSSADGWTCKATPALTEDDLFIFKPEDVLDGLSMVQCKSDTLWSNRVDSLELLTTVSLDSDDEIQNNVAVAGATRGEGQKETGEIGSIDNYTTVTVEIPSPDLKLGDSVDPLVFAGVPFSMTFVVTNNTTFPDISPPPAPLSLPLYVTHTYPVGLDYLGYTGSGWDCDTSISTPPVVSCVYDEPDHTIEPDEATSPLVLQSIAPTTSIGRAFITSNAEAITPILITNNTPDKVTIPVVIQIPNLTVKKSASVQQIINGNGSFDYFIDLRNDGGLALAPVILTDTLPAGLTLQAISAPSDWTCTHVGAEISCLYQGNYPKGAQTITLTVSPTDTMPAGTISNTARLTHEGLASLGSQTTSTTSVNILRYANITLSKERDLLAPNNGDIVAYTLAVTNAGPSSAETPLCIALLGRMPTNSDPAFARTDKIQVVELYGDDRCSADRSDSLHS